MGLGVRADDSPATFLRDHLFGGVLIAEHTVVPRASTAICLSNVSTDAVFHKSLTFAL
jgi:hypothetical protein